MGRGFADVVCAGCCRSRVNQVNVMWPRFSILTALVHCNVFSCISLSLSLSCVNDCSKRRAPLLRRTAPAPRPLPPRRPPSTAWPACTRASAAPALSAPARAIAASWAAAALRPLAPYRAGAGRCLRTVVGDDLGAAVGEGGVCRPGESSFEWKIFGRLPGDDGGERASIVMAMPDTAHGPSL